MEDINISPREATTGASKIPCLVFGNGVEAENVVYAKTSGERVHTSKSGRLVKTLPQWVNKVKPGVDVVKVHFLPDTKDNVRVGDPELVPDLEKKEIAADCVRGFIGMANYMKSGGQPSGVYGDDFYLYADTHPRFAAFLRNRCGFHGTPGNSEAWIRKSEFVSDQNIAEMEDNLTKIENPAR